MTDPEYDPSQEAPDEMTWEEREDLLEAQQEEAYEREHQASLR